MLSEGRYKDAAGVEEAHLEEETTAILDECQRLA
jgi:hypothetical protein